MLSLFSHVYIFLAVIAGLALIFFKTWAWLWVAGAVVFINAMLFLPYLPTRQAQTDASALTLYVHNLYYQNDDLAGSVAQIKAAKPDLIFLMEFSDAMALKLAEDFADYPYHLIEPSRYTMGVALFSRTPLIRPEIIRIGNTRIPVVRAGLELGGARITFVGGHPWPPLGRWGELHRAQVAAIAQTAADTATPLIVAGDFNAAPSSFVMNDLARLADVRDARLGFGIRTTSQLWGPLGFSIDHILVSDELNVLDFRQEAHAGSDHDGLIVKVAVNEKSRLAE